MKKLITILIIIASLGTSSACTVLKNPASSGETSEKPASGGEASEKPASGGEASEKPASGGEASEKPASSEAVLISAVPAQKELWKKHYYVDEFDEPTDDWYIINKNYFAGKFSNSATTNSELNVEIVFDDQNVSFFLYEYGDYPVKNNGRSPDTYTISMKDGAGNKTRMKGIILGGGDRIVVDNSDSMLILAAFLSSEKVVFHITEDEFKTTEYLFAAQTENLADFLQ